ncbi:MAG: NUDIX domain-containing protein [Candidatus Lokiarchaeota archaeon]|nr:NUDIX domain-containing protein [Candidatus Lokiarchaeota archaeon]
MELKLSESAGGIILGGEKVAIVSNKGKSWTFPKGHVEQGETPLEAAKREIYEETGISDIQLIKGLGFYVRKKIKSKGLVVKKKIHMFLFSSETSDLNLIDPENPIAKWIQKHKIKDYLSYKEDIDFYIKNLPHF